MDGVGLEYTRAAAMEELTGQSDERMGPGMGSTLEE
jgi:hypothetical protein